MLDRIVAFLTLVFLAPVMAVTAIVLRAESTGPVIVRQRRIGRTGAEIDAFVFRTSRWQGGYGAAHAPSRGSGETTLVGAVLRRTGMVELPQLFNVLNGTMSLAGLNRAFKSPTPGVGPNLHSAATARTQSPRQTSRGRTR